MENVANEVTQVNMADSVAYPEAKAETQAKTNRLAGVWLWINFMIMFLALVCTGVLVAWPLVAKLAARFTEM